MTDSVPNANYYMQRALELAARGRFSTAPNPMVGCVIVQQGEIVGEGFHQRAGEAHAEVHALAQAGKRAAGATAYVTLEPCSHFGRTPPCADALIKARLAKVVIAMQDPNPLVAGEGVAKLQAAGISVEVGVLEAQARALNVGFIARMQRQRPWLRVKMAASLDGKTALANGLSQWVTSVEARTDVHRWRALSGAVLSTAATVIADQARLTARHPETQLQPVRVIIDSQGLLTGQEALFLEPTPIIIVHAPDTPNHFIAPEQVQFIEIPRTATGGIDLAMLLEKLAQMQVNSIWTECGSSLAGALIAEQLVDELVVYLAPKLIGHSGHSLVQLPALATMEQVPTLTFKDVRQVGKDLRIIATPHPMRGDITS